MTLNKICSLINNHLAIKDRNPHLVKEIVLLLISRIAAEEIVDPTGWSPTLLCVSKEIDKYTKKYSVKYQSKKQTKKRK